MQYILTRVSDMPRKTTNSVVDGDLIVRKKLNFVYIKVGQIVRCNTEVTAKYDAPKGL